MQLTPKQEDALLDAYKGDGKLYLLGKTAERHAKQTINALCKAGMLCVEAPDTFILTEAGREQLKTVY